MVREGLGMQKAPTRVAASPAFEHFANKLSYTHRHRNKTDGCQREGGWAKKVKELRSTNW